MKRLFRNPLLSLFLDNPGKRFYVREVARKCGCSPATASNKLRELEEQGIVGKKRERHATYYKSTETPIFKAIKTAVTIERLTRAGFIKTVEENTEGLSSLLIYGSAAKGEDGENSDYDFLLVCSKCDLQKIRFQASKLGRQASIQAFTPAKWLQQSRKNRAFYLEVISSSIPLIGRKPLVD